MDRNHGTGDGANRQPGLFEPAAKPADIRPQPASKRVASFLNPLDGSERRGRNGRRRSTRARVGGRRMPQQFDERSADQFVEQFRGHPRRIDEG